MNPGVLAIWNDREESIAQLYEKWYVTEHLPERLGVPGFISARRYEAAGGSPRFFTSYDVESVDVLSSPEYLARLSSPSQLTREVMASFRNMVRTICLCTHRSDGAVLGGYAAAAYVEQPARVDHELLLRRTTELDRDPRILDTQLWRAAPDPAHASTREAQLRPGGDRRIEAAVVAQVLRDADGWAVEGAIRAALEQAGAQPGSVRFNVYRLLGQWQARPDASRT
jgi:hypothetical protein